ncbi:hypothetical protein BJX64DRAFT_115391 [Aspergillus heterothallicus]
MVLIPLFEGIPNPLIINEDRSPLTLNDPTRTLYNRAITDPTSLTDPERRLINRRPPKEEEDALCREACGFSMDELIAKALDANGHLTYRESQLLTAGVIPGQSGCDLSEAVRLPPDDRDLWGRARQAAWTEEARAAQEAARAVQARWWDAQDKARKTLSVDDERNIKYAMHVPWQEWVLGGSGGGSSSNLAKDDSSSGDLGREVEGDGRFGLVVFYDSEDARAAEFRAEIETAVHHGLHWSAHLTREETIELFSLRWVTVSGDDLDANALRTKFNTMVRNHEVPLGFRLDAFLYMDEEALASRESKSIRAYVWLAEPTPETESHPPDGNEAATGSTGITQPEAQAEQQPLKVSIKHIAPTLFARLVQRDLKGDAKRKPYRHTSELSRLHAAAGGRPRAEKDGIWPPPARYM